MILRHRVPGAPAPVGPFPHATEVDGWLFVTGQMPTWPDDPDRPIPLGIEAQSRRVMDNLGLVLRGVGLGFDRVVFARAYLIDFDAHYERFNVVYASYFASDTLPARTCIGVTGLARGALVEVDFVVRR